MRDGIRPAFHEFSAPLEGKEVPFFYLDSADPVGFVTIATGCLVDPVSTALGLPMVKRDGTRATRVEIAAAWHLVKSRQDLKKHGGMIYGSLAGNELRLARGAARELADKRLTALDAELSKLFPDFQEWCADAQLFALSWGWAVGPHSRYPRMIAALKAWDFATAANECDINPKRGTIIKRNAENRILLRNAVQVEARGLDPSVLWWPVDLSAEAPTVTELPDDVA